MASFLWKGEKALKEIERIKANYAMGILFNNKDDYIYSQISKGWKHYGLQESSTTLSVGNLTRLTNNC